MENSNTICRFAVYMETVAYKYGGADVFINDSFNIISGNAKKYLHSSFFAPSNCVFIKE